MLHLFYRLVVQPNTSRASTFAQSFISCGGIETLLVLLQREVKTGNHNILSHSGESDADNVLKNCSAQETSLGDQLELSDEKESASNGKNLVSKSLNSDHGSFKVSLAANIERMISAPENQLVKNLGGIGFSITADSARNNVYNIDDGDGIVVGILSLLGALVTNGHLKIVSNTTTTPSGNVLSTGPEGGTMFDDKVSLLLFALQKAFQAAPRKLMTTNVYTALLGATVCILCHTYFPYF